MAKLVFEVNDSKSSTVRKFDEQWRFFFAPDAQELQAEIQKIAELESERIERADGSNIQWSFVACTEIVSLNQPNGAEITSNMHTPIEADQYSKFLKAKNRLNAIA